MTESALSFGAGLLDPATGFGRGGLGRLSATQTRALRRVIELLTKVLPGLRRGNACLQVLDEHVEDVPDRHLGLDKGFQTLMHTLKLLRNSLRRSTALINEAVNELALFGCDAGWQLALSGLGRLGHRDAQRLGSSSGRASALSQYWRLPEHSRSENHCKNKGMQ